MPEATPDYPAHAPDETPINVREHIQALKRIRRIVPSGQRIMADDLISAMLDIANQGILHNAECAA